MSNLKFYLLHSESKSKWITYIVQQLTERNIYFKELTSIKEGLKLYYEDEDNSFIFVDILSSFSSFELQELRGAKCYCIIQCKYELQKTKERIAGQKIKEICIKGQSILKCVSMFSFISDFDPIVEIKSIASNHVNARLGCSDAYIHFELVDPSVFQGYRYCVDTESESLCFMIFNDNPVMKPVTEEIGLFINDKLNLRENTQENEYLSKLIYIKRMGELCQQALEEKKCIPVKPIFINEQNQQKHKEKYLITLEEQQILSAINSQQQQQSVTSTDQCIADPKIVVSAPASLGSNDPKVNQLFGTKVQFCTTGTAAINQEALIDPIKKLPNAHFSAFSTSNEKKGFPQYQQNVPEGVAYYTEFKELAKQFEGVAYIPSLPGKRKEEEMIKFIDTDETKKNYVLAEKPAFANFDSAQNFLKLSQSVQQSKKHNNEEEIQDRIFFGWHYIHYPAIQEVVARTQDGEFGQIKKIKAHFVRPKPFSTSGRIFDPNQGGCGLDRFCYPLHLALTLSKMQVKRVEEKENKSTFKNPLNKQQTFEVLNASHLNYNEIYDQNNPVFENIEGRLESKLILNESIEVELFSSMETQEIFYSEATIIFENNTQIKITWFIHPHVQFKDFKLYCVSIKHANKRSFQPFSHNVKFDKNLTSYDYQIQQMINLKNGTTHYDTIQDRFNLCTESNAYLHLVLDNIFTTSGLTLKQGL